jgi:transposase
MTKDNHNTCCAGVDVSKSKLDVVLWPCGTYQAFDYTAEGLRQLSRFMAEHKVGRIGFEASGGYERRLLEHLRAGAIPAVRLQPAQVKSFARAKLKRAKNDRLDAMLIAAFTASLESLPGLPSEVTMELAEHLTFIEQIEDQIVVVKTSLATTASVRLRRLYEAEIRRLEARREAELLRLAKVVEASEELSRRLARLCSIKGIGLRTGLALLIRLPELGSLSREEVAALTGVAPFDKDSGKTSGKRTVQGGRSRLRKSVFMAAFSARQWNPDLKAFYDRLRAKGKHHMTALVAVMRKLVILANAVVARDTDWQPTRP